jgi:hypothetical protein
MLTVTSGLLLITQAALTIELSALPFFSPDTQTAISPFLRNVMVINGWTNVIVYYKLVYGVWVYHRNRKSYVYRRNCRPYRDTIILNIF